MGDRTAEDLLALRARPEGSAVMSQRWENLLFLHWAVDPALLRPLVPPQLDLDVYDGRAHLSITPFHLKDLRPLLLPPIPGLSSFHELNVRTYVSYRGVPGIWFFSLYASRLIPAVAARTLFMLPYHKANMRYSQDPNRFYFWLKQPANPPVEFRASWKTGTELRDPHRDSLAFFLIERYCTFAVENGRVFGIRVYHHPYILEEGFVELHASTVVSALGIPDPITEPIAHFSRSLDVDVWAPVAADDLPKPA